MIPLEDRKRILTGDLDDLGIGYVDASGETLHIPEPTGSPAMVRLLADAGIRVVYWYGHGVSLPVGTVAENDRLVVALAGGAEHLHRAWRTRKTSHTPWHEPLRGGPWRSRRLDETRRT